MVGDVAIKAALGPLGAPVARLRYKGNESTFFTFQLVVGLPDAFADDESEHLSETWRVDLYSKADYSALLDQAVDALKAGGFSVSLDPETYENDTGFYHVPMTIKYVEV